MIRTITYNHFANDNKWYLNLVLFGILNTFFVDVIYSKWIGFYFVNGNATKDGKHSARPIEIEAAKNSSNSEMKKIPPIQWTKREEKKTIFLWKMNENQPWFFKIEFFSHEEKSFD